MRSSAIIKAIGIKGLAIALIILIVIFFGACAWYAIKQSIQDAIVSITKDLTFQTGEISSITVIDEKSRTISINSDELKNRFDNWFKESYIDKKYDFNDHETQYKRTEDTLDEYYFENDDILNAIKRSGYRYLITTDANFAPVSGISDMNRMHIIAIKREK